MKVELLVSRGTITESQNVGDVIDVPAKEAERMIAAGQCVPVRSGKAKKETATPKKSFLNKLAEKAIK